MLNVHYNSFLIKNTINIFIRLYSCLANGSADEFLRGEHLFKAKAVKDPLQIGHLNLSSLT